MMPTHAGKADMMVLGFECMGFIAFFPEIIIINLMNASARFSY